MQGRIAAFLDSSLPDDKVTVSKVFGPNFQTLDSWKAFIKGNLKGSVRNLLSGSTDLWTIKTFHALYISCWVHHPVEKGSFMIELPYANAAAVRAAVEKKCHKRIGSSHLSKVGYSARDEWNFLNGYHELLVQFEETAGRYFLFLKAEGHTTRPDGFIPHIVSWVHKKWYGEGKMVSPDLHDLAMKSPDLVSRRAAENYAKGYKELLKDVLGFSGKKVLVHEMLEKLYSVTGFSIRTKVSITSTSLEWGESIEQFCEAASCPGPYRMGGKITDDMLKDLRAIAKTLKSDPAGELTNRVFEEVRMTPSDLDSSIDSFCTYKPSAELY